MLLLPPDSPDLRLDRAEALLAGRIAVPPLRDAATVALVRDGAQGLEVFVQRRPSSMVFAPGMVVFPGGRVEPADFDPEIPFQGSPPEPAPFGIGPDVLTGAAAAAPDAAAMHRALLAAAVRETLEEAGVLLAAGRFGPAQLDRAQQRLAAGEPLAPVLAGIGAAIRFDDFAALSHWITPAVEPRRYDTRFFVALVPDGAQPHAASAESEAAGWAAPAQLLADRAAGEVRLLPPTMAALAELAALPDAAAALAAGHRPGLRPLLPHPWRDADGTVKWRLIDGYDGAVIG
jgi:8-oxo-dGTP pyrophosphatase MutT (NUDIX family)